MTLTTNRPDWQGVPHSVRTCAATHLRSPITRAETCTGGYSNSLAVRLTTLDGTRAFLKGVPTSHPRARVAADEIRLTTMLPDLPHTPRVLWHHSAEFEPDWYLLCTEDLGARHADMTPGSPDLGPVIDAFRALGQQPHPDPQAPPVADLIADAFTRWSRLAEDDHLPAGAAEMLDDLRALEQHWQQHADGKQLLFLDARPDNILMRDDVTATVIDWSLSVRGAPWIEGAWLVPRLMEAGHTPEHAEHVVAPLLEGATPEAVTSFAVALAGHWVYCSHLPPMPGMPRLRELHRQHAQTGWQWATSRLHRP